MEPNICRPPMLTCRWMREISASLHITCPTIPPIKDCEKDLEKQWDIYLRKILAERCPYESLKKDILAFNIDYRVLLNKFNEKNS